MACACGGQLVVSVVQPVSMRWFQGQPRGSRRCCRRPGADDPSGHGQDPEAELLGFPSAGLVVTEAESLGPGQQVGGQSDDLKPDLVLGEAVEGQVLHPGVLQSTDAVLGAGTLAMTDLELGQSLDLRLQQRTDRRDDHVQFGRRPLGSAGMSQPAHRR